MANLTKIQPSDQASFLMTFDSEESFTIPYLEVRFDCPCANCVDEMTGKKTLKKETLSNTVKPIKVEPVGRYGIHIEWTDGHRTGMYHFDRLHSLCKEKGQLRSN